MSDEVNPENQSSLPMPNSMVHSTSSPDLDSVPPPAITRPVTQSYAPVPTPVLKVNPNVNSSTKSAGPLGTNTSSSLFSFKSLSAKPFFERFSWSRSVDAHASASGKSQRSKGNNSDASGDLNLAALEIEEKEFARENFNPAKQGKEDLDDPKFRSRGVSSRSALYHQSSRLPAFPPAPSKGIFSMRKRLKSDLANERSSMKSTNSVRSTASSASKDAEEQLKTLYSQTDAAKVNARMGLPEPRPRGQTESEKYDKGVSPVALINGASNVTEEDRVTDEKKVRRRKALAYLLILLAVVAFAFVLIFFVFKIDNLNGGNQGQNNNETVTNSPVFVLNTPAPTTNVPTKLVITPSPNTPAPTKSPTKSDELIHVEEICAKTKDKSPRNEIGNIIFGTEQIDQTHVMRALKFAMCVNTTHFVQCNSDGIVVPGPIFRTCSQSQPCLCNVDEPTVHELVCGIESDQCEYL